jgi:hypothetical protein
MGNVVRITDNVSCGDHAAQGSNDVFANNLGITTEGKKKTTGHPPKFAPTIFEGPWSSTVFVNNQAVALKGKTKIIPHDKKKEHIGAKASSGSPNVSIEE